MTDFAIPITGTDAGGIADAVELAENRGDRRVETLAGEQ
jgi:hypothetical protein